MSAHQTMIWMKYFYRKTLQTAATNQTETVPNGAKSLMVKVWGGGGGGGKDGSGFGLAQGGGGGGYIQKTVSVTPGQTIGYNIGSGGAGATTTIGIAGRSSNVTISGTLYNAGGGGGGSDDGISNPLGFGGTTSGNGDVNTDGSDGQMPTGGLPGNFAEIVGLNGQGGVGNDAPANGLAGAAGEIIFIYT